MPVNQNTAPVGTLALLGHPSNDRRIVKTGIGWLYLHDAQPVQDEDFRAGWDDIPPEILAAELFAAERATEVAEVAKRAERQRRIAAAAELNSRPATV